MSSVGRSGTIGAKTTTVDTQSNSTEFNSEKETRKEIAKEKYDARNGIYDSNEDKN